MSRIKSAWEIALEKTADIQIDEKRYREETVTKNGMALAGEFLNNPEKTIEELKEKCESFSKEDFSFVKKGLKQVVLANLTLPTDDSYEFRFSRIAQISILLNPQTEVIMSQISSFFKQYLQAREEFVKRMREQINQMMKDNPEAPSSQYATLIEQNLKKMQDQYSQALESSIRNLEEVL